MFSRVHAVSLKERVCFSLLAFIPARSFILMTINEQSLLGKLADPMADHMLSIEMTTLDYVH